MYPLPSTYAVMNDLYYDATHSKTLLQKKIPSNRHSLFPTTMYYYVLNLSFEEKKTQVLFSILSDEEFLHGHRIRIAHVILFSINVASLQWTLLWLVAGAYKKDYSASVCDCVFFLLTVIKIWIKWPAIMQCTMVAKWTLTMRCSRRHRSRSPAKGFCERQNVPDAEITVSYPVWRDTKNCVVGASAFVPIVNWSWNDNVLWPLKYVMRQRSIPSWNVVEKS